MKSEQNRRARRPAATVGLAVTALALTGCTGASTAQGNQHVLFHPKVTYPAGRFVSRPLPAARDRGIEKIKHVVIITQENRSYDSYFGTYPGSDGLGPRASWPCLPAKTGVCVKPFHTRNDVSAGGPHSRKAALADIDSGAMNGFVKQADSAQRQCAEITAPQCGFKAPRQVMAYYGRRELPNYWAYAKHYVLQDHFFEASNSWSLPQHLYMVSAWSAKCVAHTPTGCHTNQSLYGELKPQTRKHLFFAWTDITYLLHAYGVSWRYYVEPGYQPDCANSGRIVCPSVPQNATHPGIWNPLPQFDTIYQDHQRQNIVSTNKFFPAARKGRLPAVSWVVPNNLDSEHPPARVSDGQAWVTRVINAIMHGRDWRHTAIFLNWDDWGGYYDGAVPPSVDPEGYGLRVPALVISPYAKRGYIDHQVLSSDAYLKFIEDRWLGGQRLDPRTDGRPDGRPDVREANPVLGNLLSDFDFHQRPLPPLILKPRPRTDLTEPPGFPPPTVQCTPACLQKVGGFR